MSNEPLSSNHCLERLLRFQKFEWNKATDDCNAGISIRFGREILATVERLTAEWQKWERTAMQYAEKDVASQAERDRLQSMLTASDQAVQAVTNQRDRLRAALGEAIGYVELDSETPTEMLAEWNAALAGAADETTAAQGLQCPVHWTYENGLRIRHLIQALADIAYSRDMTLKIARSKASRLYQDMRSKYPIDARDAVGKSEGQK